MNVPDANLAHRLIERARQTPDAVALVSRERRVSYAELERFAACGAALLQAAGLRRGESVLVFQPVSVELYAALLAIFRLGLTAMFVDPSAGRRHLEHCCEIGQPQGFLGPWKAHALRLVSGALRAIPAKFLTGNGFVPFGGTRRWHTAPRQAFRGGAEPVPADHPALLTFTSGSTGQPKAAVRTHGFLLAQHAALQGSLALEPGEIDLATLPVFVLANLASGVTSVLPDADLRRPARFHPAPVRRQIVREQPTRSAASPAFFERLLEAGAPLGGFRKVYLGGAPVFPGLLARLREAAAPGAEIVAVYGSTEAEPMAKLPAQDLTESDLAALRAGVGLPAGQPVPSIRLRVIKDHWGQPLGDLTAAEFAALEQPADGFGEIVVHGEHVLPGYLHGRGDAETKFRVDGERWHRTGDAGRLDAGGRLFLGGRCSAKVVDADGTQYPLAVECAALDAADWVRRCAFLSVAGRRTLLVEPGQGRGQPTVEQVNRLRSCIAWARLTEVRPVQTVPMDRRHNAKVDYVALAKRFL